MRSLGSNFKPFLQRDFTHKKKHKKYKKQRRDFHSDVFIHSKSIKKQTSNLLINNIKSKQATFTHK